MYFALLGNHPDGIALASALVSSGRHELVAMTANPAALPPELSNTRRVSDIEEILADPTIEAIIVAGNLTVRAAQLRRALQSERHVLCVHPAETPEAAYEAALIQRDTGFVLFPLLPEALHPAFKKLASLIQHSGGSRSDQQPSPVGNFRLLEVERVEQKAPPGEKEGLEKVSFPGWDILRLLNGEIIEIQGFAESEEATLNDPVLLAGRFVRGGLFRVTLLTGPASFWRFVLVGDSGRAELFFPQGWHGPAILTWRDLNGVEGEEYWEVWDPWPALVATFEQAVAGEKPRPLPWQDEVRSLELDAAARRSVEKRRSDVLDYQEVSEEVGFKGTMTLLGCALLWVGLLLLIGSRWVPWLGWLILPLLLVFIGLQFLRYIIPEEETPPSTPRGE